MYYALDERGRWALFSKSTVEVYGNLDVLSIASVYGDPPICIGSVPSWENHPWKPMAMRPLILGVFAWPRLPGIYAAMGHGSRRYDAYTGTRLGDDVVQVKGRLLQVKCFFFDVVTVVNRPSLDLNNPELQAAWVAAQGTRWSLTACLRDLCRQTATYQIDHAPGSHALKPSAAVRCRTILADQWPMGQRLGSGLYIDSLLPSTEEEEESLLQHLDIEDDDVPFLRGRAIIHTGGGVLGLAPRATRCGDLIAFLVGGSVPYVLRRRERRDYESEDYKYTLVGEWSVLTPDLQKDLDTD